MKKKMMIYLFKNNMAGVYTPAFLITKTKKNEHRFKKNSSKK